MISSEDGVKTIHAMKKYRRALIADIQKTLGRRKPLEFNGMNTSYVSGYNSALSDIYNYLEELK